jgi:hypothetical protein
MTTQFPTTQTFSNVIASTSLPASTSRFASPRDSAQASVREDSVHLSDAAQQYLSGSNLDSGTNNGLDMVKQLVMAAAAGDVGALSLLTVA